MSTSNLPNHDYSRWASMPTDVVLEIFSYLSISELRRASLICRRWNEISRIKLDKPKEIHLYNKKKWSRQEIVCGISHFIERLPNLEIVHFSGFASSTQLEILSNFDSMCTNVEEIHITNTMMSCDEILLTHKYTDALHKIQIRTRIFVPSPMFENFVQINEGYEVRFPITPMSLNIPFWFFEIPAVRSDNRVRELYYRFCHIREDIFYANVYECLHTITPRYYPRYEDEEEKEVISLGDMPSSNRLQENALKYLAREVFSPFYMSPHFNVVF